MNSLEIDQANNAFLVTAHGVPCLKFWLFKNSKLVSDRYVAVFDIPYYCGDKLLRAFCLSRETNEILFFAAIEERWLAEALQHGKDGYVAISHDALPENCKSALQAEIDEVLFHTKNRPFPPLRLFRVTFPDHTFDCFAEDETHAAEQAADAEIDRGYPENVQILDVYLLDYARV